MSSMEGKLLLIILFVHMFAFALVPCTGHNNAAEDDDVDIDDGDGDAFYIACFLLFITSKLSFLLWVVTPLLLLLL